MKRVKMILHGRVQGVFFRGNTQQKAQELGVKGYAKNLSDGTVEVVAEGPEEKLKELVDFCRQGPEMAEVTKADVDFGEAKNEFESFDTI